MKLLSDYSSGILETAMLLGWVFGIAVAKGFWSTAAACIFPPYAWVVLAAWSLT